MIVGVLADTHGLLREEAVEALRGCDRIVHGGDVGDPAILARLGELAPLTAVRGNVDHGAWAEELPLTEAVEAGGHTVYVLHILEELDLDPAAAGIGVVVSGHTHRPLVERRGGVLYLNPGSAGRRRFDLPATVARLDLSGAEPEAEIVELEPR